MVSKFTRLSKPEREEIINTVDLVRKEHRDNGIDHLDVLAVVVHDVDESVVEEWWHPDNYTLDGHTLYLWDWMHAIMVTVDWSQKDYIIQVLVGVI